MTFTPTLTNTPSISRASMVMLPTAYSNGWDHSDGLQLGHRFYLFHRKHRLQGTFSQPNLDSLEEVSLAILTTDVKYGWLNDDGDKFRGSPAG